MLRSCTVSGPERRRGRRAANLSAMVEIARLIPWFGAGFLIGFKGSPYGRAAARHSPGSVPGCTLYYRVEERPTSVLTPFPQCDMLPVPDPKGLPLNL